MNEPASNFRTFHCNVRGCSKSTNMTFRWEDDAFIEICDDHTDVAYKLWNEYCAAEEKLRMEFRTLAELRRVVFWNSLRDL
jgi:hypothetical protein